MGLFDFFKAKGNDFSAADKAKLDGIDPSKFITVQQYDTLRDQLSKLLKLVPETIDTSKFITQADLSGYMLKTDTVKYIENSNATSSIKKFTLSIEDKATFDATKNPTDNIAHTI